MHHDSSSRMQSSKMQTGNFRTGWLMPPQGTLVHMAEPPHTRQSCCQSGQENIPNLKVHGSFRRSIWVNLSAACSNTRPAVAAGFGSIRVREGFPSIFRKTSIDRGRSLRSSCSIYGLLQSEDPPIPLWLCFFLCRSSASKGKCNFTTLCSRGSLALDLNRFTGLVCSQA